jgi:hypothetical protein
MVTGIATSPWRGTGAYGVYQGLSAKDDAAKAALSGYAQWSFFLPALLFVGACALKEALGTAVPPGLKKRPTRWRRSRTRLRVLPRRKW